MRKRNYLVGGGVALAVLSTVLVACSSQTPNNGASPSTSSSVASSSTAAAHNDADLSFARGMIPHHEQAVEMSDMLLGKQGVDPAVLSLATEIKQAQAPEISKMQGWVQQWTASAPSSSSSSAMPDHSGHDMSGGSMGDMSGMGGHGMMSDADMTALQNAQGTAAGKLFLEQMIKHHEGAIAMARQEIDNGEFPDAVAMARSIVSSQQSEIDEMRSLLAT